MTLCALEQNCKTVSPTFFSAIFNQIFFILRGKQERHKILTVFEFQQNRTAGFEVRCPWALKKKSHLVIMGEISVSNFSQPSLIWASSNLHKISDESEFGPDQIYYLPLNDKIICWLINNLVFFFIWSSSNLQIISTCIKSQMNLNFSQIRLFTSKFTAHEW